MTEPRLTAIAAALNGAVVGDVVFVPDDYPTVTAAVVAANQDLELWTIWVRPGTWFNGTNVSQPLILQSTDGADVTSINGFSIANGGANVTVEGFTVTSNMQVPNGSSAIYKACVFDGVKLTMGTGSVVTGCSFTELGDRGVMINMT